ncbi:MULTISPECIES: hypothetical protein [Streptomycetaceae]|uniref:Prefoldin subunit 5 n=1 Tax=Streptantibioticus cattleyicolor (strain ATCC 35852 / DSM 46488 / JCM 4925 / NBRC 14057 / NRRL 8057) TaxID=1003195 RepID=F8JPY8_STREN|nr:MULTISPECIES: hypothetical protein [Streptomycetaceae]AEW94047.1 hypothetical protein SCATT_16760 [Streptantibioticus cattleyicolor NRRL 8057 = DSM 46488]MYS58720.1 hypothetical protein [Streptomyces sp. SID5468]CCB74399.1 protein of unknown function [Streptantibioticus cattleyicolor NRRL 8057 = DSM 46488]
MAVTGGIRIGNAFIEITPQMDDATLTRQLAEVEKQIKAFYTRASDVTKAYSRLQTQLEAVVTAR